MELKETRHVCLPTVTDTWVVIQLLLFHGSMILNISSWFYTSICFLFAQTGRSRIARSSSWFYLQMVQFHPFMNCRAQHLIQCLQQNFHPLFSSPTNICVHATNAVYWENKEPQLFTGIINEHYKLDVFLALICN